jgi:hypothetical protein
MWLAIDLALAALGLVLVVVFGLFAYGRFRRMNRFGARASGRVSVLAEQAGRLGERVDALSERADANITAARQR